uniref:Uncharacterized protein n=1 Tax=Human herpesvirus 1 TaxID=10298 RepID=A0A2Z4H0V4_HHV1|nr:hypothetical protein [Human alphaherpesvirus 1]
MCHTQGCVGGDFGQQPGRAQQGTLRVVHGGSGRLPVLTPPFIDLIAYVGVRPGPNPHVVQEGVRHFQGPRHAPRRRAGSGPRNGRRRSPRRGRSSCGKARTRVSPLLRPRVPPSSAPASPLLRPRVPPPPPPRPPSSAPASPPPPPTQGAYPCKKADRWVSVVGGPRGASPVFRGWGGRVFPPRVRVSLSDAIPIPSRGVAMPTPSAPTALCDSRSRSACSAAAPVVRGRRRLRASVAPGLYVRRRDPPPAARARPRGRRGVGHGASARTSP